MEQALIYPVALAIISVLVAALERVFPDREQKQVRPALGWDFLHLLFNGHFLGLVFFGFASKFLLPGFDRWLGSIGVVDDVYRNAAADWPLWLQIIVAMVVVDFLQWCVHVALHRIPFLWEMHKCHHSVEDGEMDWIVSFRFQWTEVAVYRMVLYLPLAFFGFSGVAVLVHAIFGTLIGHLNHANLKISWGPLRYIFNSPKMHIWHHDYEGDTKTTKNFGIIFSIWDWLFGTAYMPDHPPKKIGFPGSEEFPKNFFAAEIWPLQRWIPAVGRPALATAVGAVLVAGGLFLAYAPTPGSTTTPMLGESRASSQPAAELVASADAYSASAADATAALELFGARAAADGFALPTAMVSVDELAKALGAPELVVLDVRPRDRYLAGHIPSARQLDRPDYSASEPYPGVNRTVDELQQMLRDRGVGTGSVVVAYTDGGPEAYRLWWTLREAAGYDIRVLDGGLQQWTARGHQLAEGEGLEVPAGNVVLQANPAPRLARWDDVQAFVADHADALLLDSRSADEFSGAEVRSSAARGGHIPGALHMEWWSIVRDVEADHRLSAPDALRALFDQVGITPDRPVVSYCQSGTRSAAVYFAMLQLGADPQQVVNYDGSWAEYSRLDLPADL